MINILKIQLKLVIYLAVLFLPLSQKLYSQACTGSQVTISIQNAMITAANKFTFELWVSNTGSTSERISAYGGGIFPNIALSTGYTVVVVEQPSDLGWTMNPITPNVTQTTNIRWTNNPNAASTSMIPAASTKIAKFEVTSAILPASLTFATSGTQPQMTAYCAGNPNSNTMTFANGKLVYANNNAPVLIAPLPIKLNSFSAEKAGEKRAKLNWSSSSEINASHYEVERSEDAENFEKIGDVKAAGNSQSLLQYQFFDQNIPSLRSNTILYYRLRMVDLDGSYEYSDIRGLNFGNALEGVFMYPNPTNQWLNVDVNGIDFEDGAAELNIFDMDGRLLIAKKVIGSGIEAVDMGQVSAGVYHVVLKKGRDVFNEKVVVID